MKTYAIVIERASANFSAYAPDVPGCITVGDTLDEVRRNMAEALEFHFAGLQSDGQSIPQPSAEVTFVTVNVE